MKMIKVPADLHKMIKLAAAKEGLTMMDFLRKVISQYTMMILLLPLFVSCASKHYVKVDEVNYGRFQHKQKFVEWMTMKQVLETFGSPQIAEESAYMNKGLVWWTYKDAIFCNHKSDRCHIGFRNGRAIMQVNIRMEFDNSLVNVL